MNTTDHLDIYIAPDQAMNRAFIDAWKKAEQNVSIEPIEQLYFEDAATLLRVLSNQRLALLSTLRKIGPSSIRYLSKIMKRNYKNVHSDVTLLRKAGLIQLNDQSLVFVPWQKIHTEIDLMAAA